MTRLSDERLADIEARAEAATPGPWTGKIEPQRYPECDDADLPGIVRSANGIEVAAVDERYGDGQNYEADTAFIAHARSDIPALLAELKELRAEREALEKAKNAEPDWWWRDLDPDENGDCPHQALVDLPDFTVCLLHSSFAGPSKYAFRAPTLCLDDDNDEVVMADTEEEAMSLAEKRVNDLKALEDFAALQGDGS